MQITIHNEDIADDQLLGDVLFRTGAWWRQYDTADVYCTERNKDGWLEYGIRLQSANGAGMYVGAIQRQPGAKTEFHS